MKKNLIVLSLAVFALSSCSRFKTGDGGLQYNIHTDKDGQAIKEGDFIVIKGMQTTEGDSVIFSTYETDRPAFLVCQKPQFKGDLYSGLTLLSEGDSATFKINLDTLSAKTSQPKPPFAGKDHYMIFKVKVEKVIPKGKLNDKDFGDKINAFIKADAEATKKAEGAKLKSYIDAKGLKPLTTATGLKYVITKQGAGVKANVGDTVEVNYTGSFLGGKVFDTSYPEVAKKAGTYNAQRPYSPLKMPVGLGKSIPGFDEGLMLFPKGTKVTLILPSTLAYGERGNQGIPPFTPLVFELDILNVIPANAAAVAAPAAPLEK